MCTTAGSAGLLNDDFMNGLLCIFVTFSSVHARFGLLTLKHSLIIRPIATFSSVRATVRAWSDIPATTVSANFEYLLFHKVV